MSGANLLLADDDDANRLTLAALLEDEGFAVEEVATFDEARRALESGRSYAAVVLDLHLGDREATPLLEIAGARQPDARTVVVTGDTAAESVAGVDFVFYKGADTDALLAVLRS